MSSAGVILDGTEVTVGFEPAAGSPELAHVTVVAPEAILPNQNLELSASYAIAILSFVAHVNKADPSVLSFTTFPSFCIPQLNAVPPQAASKKLLDSAKPTLADATLSQFASQYHFPVVGIPKFTLIQARVVPEPAEIRLPADNVGSVSSE